MRSEDPAPSEVQVRSEDLLPFENPVRSEDPAPSEVQVRSEDPLPFENPATEDSEPELEQEGRPCKPYNSSSFVKQKWKTLDCFKPEKAKVPRYVRRPQTNQEWNYRNMRRWVS